MHRPRIDYLLALILGLTLVRGVVYASVIPPWQAPDEPKHFEYVALLQDKRRLVTYEDASPELQREIITSMRVHDFWRFGYVNTPELLARSFEDVWKNASTQLNRPPIYYIAASLFSWAFRGGPLEAQLYVIRLFSILLGVLTVLMAYLAVRTVFPKDVFLPPMAASFIAFLPMHSFITSSANSDNMANLIAAALALLMARLFKQGATTGSLIGILGLIASGLWTKRTTIFAVPLFILAVPLYLAGRRIRTSFWVLLGSFILLLGVAAVAIARSYRLRSGMSWILDRYFFNYSVSANLAQFGRHDYTPEDLFNLYTLFARRIFDSFWAQFGWMNVRLDSYWYDVLLGVSLLSLLGLVILGVRLAMRKERLEAWQAKVLALYLVWTALVVVITYVQYTAEFSVSSFPQGRYLFPALVPIATYFALGLKSLLPKAWQSAFIVTLLAGLFLLDTLALGLNIVPFYYSGENG